MAGAESPVIATFQARTVDLPPWLQAHIGRVVVEGRRLAQILEVDPGRVQAAALGHDLYRHLDGAALLAQAASLGMETDAAERAAPILLHGPIAADRAEREWGVTDADVLEAIRWHTTGRPGLGAVGLTLFLADKVEPQKVAADPGLTPIRSLAGHDPEAAMLALLERRLGGHLSRGEVMHSATLEARNWYLARMRERATGGA